MSALPGSTPKDEFLSPFMIQGHVNDQNVSVLLDSGSAVDAVSERFAHRLGLQLSPSTVQLKHAGSCPLTVLGETFFRISLPSVSPFQVQAVCVRNLSSSVLLGNPTMRRELLSLICHDQSVEQGDGKKKTPLCSFRLRAVGGSLSSSRNFVSRCSSLIVDTGTEASAETVPAGSFVSGGLSVSPSNMPPTATDFIPSECVVGCLVRTPDGAPVRDGEPGVGEGVRDSMIMEQPMNDRTEFPSGRDGLSSFSSLAGHAVRTLQSISRTMLRNNLPLSIDALGLNAGNGKILTDSLGFFFSLVILGLLVSVSYAFRTVKDISISTCKSLLHIGNELMNEGSDGSLRDNADPFVTSMNGHARMLSAVRRVALPSLTENVSGDLTDGVLVRGDEPDGRVEIPVEMRPEPADSVHKSELIYRNDTPSFNIGGRPSDNSTFYFDERLTVPPQGMAFVKVKLPSCKRGNVALLPDDSRVNVLQVTPAVVSAGPNTVTRVINLSDEPITIQRFQKAGQAFAVHMLQANDNDSRSVMNNVASLNSIQADSSLSSQRSERIVFDYGHKPEPRLGSVETQHSLHNTAAPASSVPVITNIELPSTESHVPVTDSNERVVQLSDQERSEFLAKFKLDETEFKNKLRNEIEQLLLDNYDLFARDDTDVGRFHNYEHSIELSDLRPLPYRRYKLSQEQAVAAEAFACKLERSGVVERSDSKYLSNLLLLKKKDGCWRPVLDLRALNTRIVSPQICRLPTAQQLFDYLGGSRYYGVCDLISGYHHVPLSESSRKFVSFETPSGRRYSYKCLVQGLKDGAFCFSYVLKQILQGLTMDECLLYLDEVLFHSATLEGLLDIIRRAFDKLRTEGTKLKPEKCAFGVTSLSFLGFSVSPEGVRPLHEKVAAICNARAPRNAKEVKSLIALLSYYRRFCDSFSTIVEPLNRLLRKGISFEWGQEQEDSFQVIKGILSSRPLLAHPDFTKQFYLATDASLVGVSGYLYYLENDEERIISYFSRSLNKQQRRYATFDRELLAVFESVVHFKHYLSGRKFFIVTDHKPLKGIFTLDNKSDRIMRQVTYLSEFDFEILYREGSQNQTADFLSRDMVASRCPLSREQDILAEQDGSSPSIGVVSSNVGGRIVSKAKVSLGGSCNELYYRRQPPRKVDRVSLATVSDGSSRGPDFPPEENGVLTVAPDRLSTMNVTDFVSRDQNQCHDVSVTVNSDSCEVDSSSEMPVLNAVVRLDPSMEVRCIARAQADDPLLLTMMGWFLGEDCPKRRIGDPYFSWWVAKEAGHLEFKEGILRHKGRLVVPQKLIPVILNEMHNQAHSGHPGIFKLVKAVSERFFFQSMTELCAEWVNSCQLCLCRKASKKVRAPLLPIPYSNPLEAIHVDHVGPIKCYGQPLYLLTMIDRGTRFCEVVIVKNTSAVETANAVYDNWITRYSIPKVIVSDRGTAFVNRVFDELGKILGIKLVRTTPLHPESNGLVERFNRTLITTLTRFIQDNPDNWPTHLSSVLWAYRTSFHSSMGCSPHAALYGVPDIKPIDVHFGQVRYDVDILNKVRRSLQDIRPKIQARVEEEQARWKVQYDKKVNDPPLNVGDTVVLYTPAIKLGITGKLQDKFSPNFTVIEKISDLTYRVASDKFVTTVHRNRLKRVASRRPELRTDSSIQFDFPSFFNSKLTHIESGTENVMIPRSQKDPITPGGSNGGACNNAPAQEYRKLSELMPGSTDALPPTTADVHPGNRAEEVPSCLYPEVVVVEDAGPDSSPERSRLRGRSRRSADRLGSGDRVPGVVDGEHVESGERESSVLIPSGDIRKPRILHPGWVKQTLGENRRMVVWRRTRDRVGIEQPMGPTAEVQRWRSSRDRHPPRRLSYDRLGATK